MPLLHGIERIARGTQGRSLPGLVGTGHWATFEPQTLPIRPNPAIRYAAPRAVHEMAGWSLVSVRCPLSGGGESTMICGFTLPAVLGLRRFRRIEQPTGLHSDAEGVIAGEEKTALLS